MKKASSSAFADPRNLRIDFTGMQWRLREVGAVFDLRRDASKAILLSYVEGFMQGRTGRLVVEKEDGSIDFERSFGLPPAPPTLAAQVETAHIVVEERRIGLGMPGPDWKRHEYAGLADLPEALAPAFGTPGSDDADALDLRALVQRACAEGKRELRIEAPYSEGRGRAKTTVLRTVSIELKFRQAQA